MHGSFLAMEKSRRYIYFRFLPSFSLRAASLNLGEIGAEIRHRGCVILIIQYAYTFRKSGSVCIHAMRTCVLVHIKRRADFFGDSKSACGLLFILLSTEIYGSRHGVTVKARSRYCCCSIFLSWAIILRDGTIGHANLSRRNKIFEGSSKDFSRSSTYTLRLDLKFPPRWFSERIFSIFYDG